MYPPQLMPGRRPRLVSLAIWDDRCVVYGAWCAARSGASVAFVRTQFSPDFYITCATVIPVLFLAVTVQGPAWGWVLSTSERAGRYSNPILRRLLRLESAVPGDRRWQRTRKTLAELMIVPLVVILLVSVTACGLGEGLALYVLYRGSESVGDRRDVLVATLFLLAAVLAGRCWWARGPYGCWPGVRGCLLLRCCVSHPAKQGPRKLKTPPLRGPPEVRCPTTRWGMASRNRVLIV